MPAPERVDRRQGFIEPRPEAFDLRASVRLGRLGISPGALLRRAPALQRLQLLLQLGPCLGELHHLPDELRHLALLLRAEIVEGRVRVVSEGHVRPIGRRERIHVVGAERGLGRRLGRRRRVGLGLGRRLRGLGGGCLGVGRDALPRAEVGVVLVAGRRRAGAVEFVVVVVAPRFRRRRYGGRIVDGRRRAPGLRADGGRLLRAAPEGRGRAPGLARGIARRHPRCALRRLSWSYTLMRPREEKLAVA